MKKYKLIKNFPGSPKLGAVNTNDQLSWKAEDYPEFWQEVATQYVKCIKAWSSDRGESILEKIYNTDIKPDFSGLGWSTIINSTINPNHFIPSTKEEYDAQQEVKEYEIIALISSNDKVSTDYKNGKVKWTTDSHPQFISINELLDGDSHKIHSVKRLSDGEIFTVGDKFDDGDLKNETIISFNISSVNGLLINSNLLKNVSKRKQPLFTTEDGFDIYDLIDSGFSYVLKENFRICTKFSNTGGFRYEPEREWYFSTKEAAEEYILMNKPCLSYNDLIHRNIQKDSVEYVITRIPELKDLIKSKLNEK